MNNLPFQLRDYCESDVPQMQAIYADAVLNGKASFDETPPSHEDLSQKFKALSDDGFFVLVAEDEAGHVLGYAYIAAYRPRSAYRFTVENSIYVSPKAKRQGVGKVLVKETLKRAKNDGYKQMVAVIGGGEPASVALHLTCGFQHVGRLPNLGYKNGHWLDIVLMQREI